MLYVRAPALASHERPHLLRTHNTTLREELVVLSARPSVGSAAGPAQRASATNSRQRERPRNEASSAQARVARTWRWTGTQAQHGHELVQHGDCNRRRAHPRARHAISPRPLPPSCYSHFFSPKKKAFPLLSHNLEISRAPTCIKYRVPHGSQPHPGGLQIP